MSGFVSLVGAGPGDPGLLTIAGRDRLAGCDVVVYDRLIGAAILDYAPASAERIFAGKEPRRAALSQDQINDLLVAKARAGKRVVRLKGGDPFVFGRGGEEALALVAAEVPFDVVPGVTSAVAAPAYAGIPVTHRGLASSFAVVTGHEDETKPDASVDWSLLATAVDTIVVLMGGAALAGVATALIAAGRPGDTPAASIEWGTTNQQRSVSAPLSSIAAEVRKAKLGTPLLTVIGQVASLRDQLAWFEKKPLFGKRVLVTRTREQASELSALLREQGAVPIELPTIEVQPYRLLDARKAARQVDGTYYGWVIFTSANAVQMFWRALDAEGLDGRSFFNVRIAAMGGGTETALLERGTGANLVPQVSTSDGMLASLRYQDDWETRDPLPLPRPGLSRVLYVCADDGLRTVPEGLEAMGAEVTVLPVYQTVAPDKPDPEVLQQIRAGRIDIVTFASSSSVRNLAQLLGDDLARLNEAVVACIGPVTASTARELGLRVDIEPETHNIPALVEALAAHHFTA